MDTNKKKAIEKIAQQWIDMFQLAADGPWGKLRPSQFKVQIVFVKEGEIKKIITMPLREMAETSFLMVQQLPGNKQRENIYKLITRRQATKKAIALLNDIDAVMWEETVAEVEGILCQSIEIESQWAKALKRRNPWRATGV
jgi:hypothetical protein